VKVTCMDASDQPAHKSVMTEMIYSNSWVWACHKCPIKLNYTGQACGKVEPTLVLSPSGARLLGPESNIFWDPIWTMGPWFCLRMGYLA
jgi:hypothetical protein